MAVRLAAMKDAMTLPEFLLARIAEDEARVEGIRQGDDPDFYWGPDRIRAECAAKRQIVEYWAPAVDYDRDRFIVQSTLEAAATASLRYLAAVYADHPDYREEWRP